MHFKCSCFGYSKLEVTTLLDSANYHTSSSTTSHLARPGVFPISLMSPCFERSDGIDMCMGRGSFFMQAVSRMFVQLPIVSAWVYLRCWRKWSARKNFFDWLHSLNLCTRFKCSDRASQSAGLEKFSPQYPHTSVAVEGALGRGGMRLARPPAQRRTTSVAVGGKVSSVVRPHPYS